MSREGNIQPSPSENGQDPNELHYQAYMLPAYIPELEAGSSDLDKSYLQDQQHQVPGHTSRAGDIQRYPSFSASDSSSSYHQQQHQQVYSTQGRQYQSQVQQHQIPRGQQSQQFRPAHDQYYQQSNQQMYNQQQYRPNPSSFPPPYQPPSSVISNVGQQLPPGGQFQPQQALQQKSYISSGQNQLYAAEQRRPMISLPPQAVSQQRNSPQYFTSTPTSRSSQNFYPPSGQSQHYFPRQNESDHNDSNISERVQALSLSDGVQRYGSPKSSGTPQFINLSRSQQGYESQSPSGGKLVQPQQYQYSSDQDYNDVPRVIEVNEQPTPSPRMFQDHSNTKG